MTDGKVQLVYPDGQPIPPVARQLAGNGRARALIGGRGSYSGPPYDAADVYGQHMSQWAPWLWSPDTELNQYRDRIVSRVRDLVRNDGWASGAVTRILDNCIGSNLRPIAKPDYKYLAIALNDKRYDLAWAKEWGKVASAHWRAWAIDDEVGRWCDGARNQIFPQMMMTAFRHKLVDGDALAVMGWDPSRVGRGRAKYATFVQAVDPDRLSNPQMRFDTMELRGGVEIDEAGAAQWYHIRRAHQGDWWAAYQSMVWDRIPRETPWGRPIVVFYDYDLDRATTHRGGAGIFTPILTRMKMLAKYDSAEVDSAIINSLFAAYFESPFDAQLAGDALDDGEHVGAYQQMRTDFHKANDIVLGNARIPVTFPGEKIGTVQASHPHGNFREFENAVLRNGAAALGLSAQQFSNDWSDVNYSSARGALLEAWKTLDRRRLDFARGYAGQVQTTWLEESIEVDEYPWPDQKNPPDFPSFRGALARADWLGPALGWIDPVAEVQASVMRMDGSLSTLERECAQQGLDFEEVMEQRSYELKLFDELGIPRPQWAGALVGAQDAATKETGAKIAPPPRPQKAT